MNDLEETTLREFKEKFDPLQLKNTLKEMGLEKYEVNHFMQIYNDKIYEPVRRLYEANKNE